MAGTESPLVTHRSTCRACGSTDLALVLDLGTVPLAGGFLDESDIPREVKLPLALHFCRSCTLAQVLDVVDPDVLFKRYFYSSSAVKSLSEHFREYADFLKKKYLTGSDARLLEFGSNDGVFLQYLAGDSRVRAVGIDPSENVSAMAREKGLTVITGYFTRASAAEIREKYGEMDVVTGSNVFAHVDDVHEILKAARAILKPEGVFIVEIHCLKDLIELFQYDTVYHEHLSYFSIESLRRLLAAEGFKIVEVVHFPMHGGAMRVIAAPTESARKSDGSAERLLEAERSFVQESALKEFGVKAAEHRNALRALLDRIKAEGKSVVGYGAPGRGTILLNYCGIDGKYLDYIVDASPLRAGKLMPGVHVPIYPPEKSRAAPPDYFLLLAWSYAAFILEQERELREKGVKFIVPFPQIAVL